MSAPALACYESKAALLSLWGLRGSGVAGCKNPSGPLYCRPGVSPVPVPAMHLSITGTWPREGAAPVIGWETEAQRDLGQNGGWSQTQPDPSYGRMNSLPCGGTVLPCPALPWPVPCSPHLSCWGLSSAVPPCWSLVPQPLLWTRVCGHLWAETQVLGPLHAPQLHFPILYLYLGPRAASSCSAQCPWKSVI